MKKTKSIFLIVLAVLLAMSLCACTKWGTTIKTKNVFDDTVCSISLPRSFFKPFFPVQFSGDVTGTTFTSNTTLEKVYSKLQSRDSMTVKKVSDSCISIQMQDSAETYLLIKESITYLLTVPYVGLNLQYSDKSGGPYLFFPIQFISGQSISTYHNIQPDTAYPSIATREEFKKFYADTGKFVLEDTDDGFIVRGYQPGVSPPGWFQSFGAYRLSFASGTNGGTVTLSYEKL